MRSQPRWVLRKEQEEFFIIQVFGFDIDGVLTNDDDGKENIWAKEAGKFLNKPVVKWTFRLEEALLVSPQEIQRFLSAKAASILNNVPIRPYCRDVLYRLRDQGCPIHLITARNDYLREITVDWLKKHEVPYDYLHTNPYTQGNYSKGRKCKELGIEFFVDDRLENCVDVHNQGIYTLLYHSSHNKDSEVKIPRVYNWQDISQHIDRVLETPFRKKA